MQFRPRRSTAASSAAVGLFSGREKERAKPRAGGREPEIDVAVATTWRSRLWSGNSFEFLDVAQATFAQATCGHRVCLGLRHATTRDVVVQDVVAEHRDGRARIRF
jgi:hypothetical protein